MKNVIIIILCIVWAVISGAIKSKKKANAKAAAKKNARPAARPPHQEPTFPPFTPAEEIFEPKPNIFADKTAPLQEMEEEIAKTDEYFTYETIEPEISTPNQKPQSYSAPSVNINVQNVDYEEEKNPKLTFEMEEFYKGIIYAEILKRPYN